MLSREDRILSELIVSRGLAEPAIVELRARELEDSNETGLAQALVSHGELDPETGRQVSDEAREIDGLLRADLPEGQMLGEFRLVREIGRGGMGIVYEAEQVPLGRRVALKVLPAGAALDERLAIRFLREARTVARLRHPGIVPVFGTGREQGVLFFAMELIEGESLAQRIERGPLPAADAARIASEIAHALQHAHDAGLIHRDVKPDNVMIGRDGRARLADFGLVHDLQGARLTRSQYVLGTPAYSAPEQARGEPVDPRSDVYGAGAVLYAMLGGKPPFAGDVPAAVLGRLASEPPPPLAQVAPAAPRALVAICERAMARDPGRRYAGPGALGQDLDRFLEQGSTAAERSPSSASRGWWLVGAGLGLATLIVAGLFSPGFRNVAPGPVGGDSVVPAGLLDGTHRLVLSSPGRKRGAVLSPDGEMLAFSWEVAGRSRLYIQDLADESAPREIPLDDRPACPAWSPDGGRLAYCRSEQLEVLDIATGRTELVGAACGPMSWSPDGTGIVHEERAWPATRLRVLDLASRESRLITGPGTGEPSWSSDGMRIAYVALTDGRYDVWTLPVAGGEPRRVTDDAAADWSPVWSSVPGRLYFGSDRDGTRDLWSVRIDTRTGTPLSDPTAATRGWVGVRFSLAAASERDRLALAPLVDLSQIWALPLDSRARPLGPPRSLPVDLPFDVRSPQRAPDREEWIVAAPDGDGVNLRRLDLDASSFVRVTDGPYRDGSPRWSPDGRSIALDSDRSGNTEIWTVRPDGSGLTRITRSGAEARSPVWSPDGRRLAYTVDGDGPWVVTLADGDARALDADDATGDSAGFVTWSWSEDGKRLAGTSDGIVVYDIDTRRYTRLTDFGDRPVWLGASRDLVFVHGDRVYACSGNGDDEPRVIWSAGPSRLASDIGVRDDGREIYFTGTGSSDDIWILDF